MKTLLQVLFIGLTSALYSQNCEHIIPPASNTPTSGIYHVFDDSTINDQAGSIYYICSGVHLTVEWSGGSSYYMEENSQLTILDSGGDAVYAKGNCVISENSNGNVAVWKEASTVVNGSAPTIICPTMVFDYSLIGGSSPCDQINSISENDRSKITMYPNPVNSGGSLTFNENVNSLRVYSLGGQLLFQSEDSNTNELVIPSLKSGFYITTGTTAAGDEYQFKLKVL